MWPVAAQHSFIPSFKHVMPNSVRNTEDLLLHPLSFFYKTSLFRCVPTYQSFIFLNHQVCFLYHYPDSPCPCLVCASLSHRFGWSLQQSGKLSSRKLWQIIDCWVTLWQQSPRLLQSFLIADRGVCWALAYGLRYCIRKNRILSCWVAFDNLHAVFQRHTTQSAGSQRKDEFEQICQSNTFVLVLADSGVVSAQSRL